MSKSKRYIYLFSLAGIFVALFLAIAQFVFVSTFHESASYKILSAEIFPPPHIGGILKSRIYGVIYGSLFITIAAFYAAAVIFRNRRIRFFFRTCLYKLAVFPLFVVLFFAITFFQMFVHAQYFHVEKLDYVGKTLEQKQAMIFEYAYTFSKDVRQKIPGAHVAQIITDLDLNRAAEMTLHRQLCYFLYPINVRSHPDDAVPEVLIFLGKKNAVQAVPPGYEVIHRYDDENMVAVKTGVHHL